MRIKGDNRVVSFAHLPHENDEETEKPEDNSAPEEEIPEEEKE